MVFYRKAEEINRSASLSSGTVLGFSCSLC